MKSSDVTKFKTLTFSFLVSLIFLNLAIWCLPGMSFSSFRIDDPMCRFWYYLSQSSSHRGSSIILVLVASIYASQKKDLKQRGLQAVCFYLAIGGLLWSVSAFNERVIKPWIALSRPSIAYLAKRGVLDQNHYYFVLRTKEERRVYLNDILEKNQVASRIVDHEKIHPLILKHWVEESGFSFPSGHALNSFLFGGITSFLILFLFNNWIRRLYVVPLIWAVFVGISRAAIGAHHPIDISGGSFLGATLAIGVAMTLNRVRLSSLSK